MVWGPSAVDVPRRTCSPTTPSGVGQPRTSDAGWEWCCKGMPSLVDVVEHPALRKEASMHEYLMSMQCIAVSTRMRSKCVLCLYAYSKQARWSWSLGCMHELHLRARTGRTRLVTRRARPLALKIEPLGCGGWGFPDSSPWGARGIE